MDCINDLPDLLLLLSETGTRDPGLETRDSEAVNLSAELSQPLEMIKDLTIMERHMEPLLPMEVSKNLLSSVTAVGAACMAYVLLTADFWNLQALYSAVKLSQ